jgi:serine protease AprX
LRNGRRLLLLALIVAVPTFGTAQARVVATPSAAGALASELTTQLDELGPGETTTVIVRMRAQADLAGIYRPTSAGRARATVRALQATATVAQASLLRDLESAASAGTVDSIVPLWVFDGISLTATADVIREVAGRPDVEEITPDAIDIVPTFAPAEGNVEAIQAPTLWARGDTGQGVVVASLDSGVDATHPDLSGSWRGGTNSWFDPYGQHATVPTDPTGHGTGTMGVIVGGDAGGTTIGVAPGAKWIAAKIFSDNGTATATAIHQAFQWVLDPDGDPTTADAPDVVNNSWSIGTGPSCDLTFQSDLQALRAANILPVFAAGNYGPGSGTSASPANDPEAFAVGAVDDAGGLWSSSSRGATACGGSTGVFPELAAPGVDVTTAERYGLYQTASGTSLAAPHVAGALALLLSAHPDLTADQQAYALTQSATDLGTAGPDDAYGYGMLDVAAAEQLIDGGGLPPAPPPPPADLVFADSFGSGDLGAWSGAATNGGRLAVSPAAALDADAGLQARIENTGAMYVADASPSGEGVYRARFSFDPNGTVVPSRKNHVLLLGLSGSGAELFRIQLLPASTGSYGIRACLLNNRGKFQCTSTVTMTDAVHQLEVLWTTSSSSSKKDGSIELSIDGAVGASKSGAATGGTTLEEVRLGPQSVGKGVKGVESFDAFVSTRGSTIG